VVCEVECTAIGSAGYMGGELLRNGMGPGE
jgi:hypothetical protein